MPARKRFIAEIEARNLDLPSELYHELRALCSGPLTGATLLWPRLLRGAEVIDRRGGKAAPDAIWLRWEAIFVAWHCCEQELAERRKSQRPEQIEIRL